MSMPALQPPEESDRGSSLTIETVQAPKMSRPGSIWLGSGSLATASLEAICTFFLAASKLGILVGFTSFLSTVIVSRYHADRVRGPVLAVALGGAIVNLIVLANQRRLRHRPAAAWRTRPLTVRQRRRIWLLIGLSVLTIALIVGEFWIHPVRLF